MASGAYVFITTLTALSSFACAKTDTPLITLHTNAVTHVGACHVKTLNAAHDQQPPFDTGRRSNSQSNLQKDARARSRDHSNRAMSTPNRHSSDLFNHRAERVRSFVRRHECRRIPIVNLFETIVGRIE